MLKQKKEEGRYYWRKINSAYEPGGPSGWQISLVSVA